MKALIRIVGTQKLEEQEPDTLELTTTGTLEQGREGWRLSYQETDATGLSGTLTTLHITPQRVTLERTGANASLLVLEKHRRHHSNYATPYGMLDLGTYANELSYSLNEAGGELHFSYTLGFNGGINSVHTVHITVQEDKTPCPIS